MGARINGKEVSYDEFVDRYLSKNRPVVLTSLMDDWRACKDWVTGNGRPNLQFFATHFGKSKVQVADCGTRQFSDQKRQEMSVSEFVDHWLENYAEERSSDSTCFSDGSWTPLHADVFRSYSWSANVCGKKKWIFLPPSQSHLVFDWNMKSCVYNIFEDASETKYPGFKKALWLECIQEHDEIIFVPSGWFYEVHNLEDTISINHNWFNGYNLSWVWDLLSRDYNETEEYIEDIKDICDDFEAICQCNLAANTGMNFYDFFIFISRFSLSNMVQLHSLHTDYENPISNSSTIARHLALNLASIRKILLKMKSIDGLAGNNRYLDLRETLDDPEFLKMCMGLAEHMQ